MQCPEHLKLSHINMSTMTLRSVPSPTPSHHICGTSLVRARTSHHHGSLPEKSCTSLWDFLVVAHQAQNHNASMWYAESHRPHLRPTYHSLHATVCVSLFLLDAERGARAGSRQNTENITLGVHTVMKNLHDTCSQTFTELKFKKNQTPQSLIGPHLDSRTMWDFRSHRPLCGYTNQKQGPTIHHLATSSAPSVGIDSKCPSIGLAPQTPPTLTTVPLSLSLRQWRSTISDGWS